MTIKERSAAKTGRNQKCYFFAPGCGEGGNKYGRGEVIRLDVKKILFNVEKAIKIMLDVVNAVPTSASNRYLT